MFKNLSILRRKQFYIRIVFTLIYILIDLIYEQSISMANAIDEQYFKIYKNNQPLLFISILTHKI